jgi:hypothetical protein
MSLYSMNPRSSSPACMRIGQILGWLDRHGGVTPARRSDKLTLNDVQMRTATADAGPYTQTMQTDFVKAALVVAWVLAVGALGYMAGTTSLTGWTLVALVSLVPPALMMRLSRAPSPSMSETIREVRR